MNTPNPHISITAAVPSAITITADKILVGDSLFDSHGGTHRISKVTKRGIIVRTFRSDGIINRWAAGDTVTILPDR